MTKEESQKWHEEFMTSAANNPIELTDNPDYKALYEQAEKLLLDYTKAFFAKDKEDRLERMQKEYSGLSAKVERLEEFLGSNEMEFVSDEKEELMYSQLRAMKAYRQTLRERIVIEENELSNAR